jgi:hypothetical protein
VCLCVCVCLVVCDLGTSKTGALVWADVPQKIKSPWTKYSVKKKKKQLRTPLNYSMEHCPPLKAKSSFLNKGPPLFSIYSQLNPVHSVSSKLFKPSDVHGTVHRQRFLSSIPTRCNVLQYSLSLSMLYVFQAVSPPISSKQA